MTNSNNIKEMFLALNCQKNIEKLDISNNYGKLNDFPYEALINYLKAASNLKSFSICGIHLPNQVLIEIFKELKEHNKICRLNLSNTDINEKGAFHIAEFVKSHISLTELDVSNNPINYLGIRDIAKALSTNQTLQILNLADIPIDALSSKAIQKYIKSNISLIGFKIDNTVTHNVNLNLGSIIPNSIIIKSEILETPDLLNLANYLSTYKNIDEFSLINCELTDDSLTILLDALSEIPISTLNLSHNKISDQGAIELSNWISKHGTKLNSLWLPHNQIGDLGMNAIASVNVNLESFAIRGNPIGNTGFSNILNSLTKNIELFTVIDMGGLSFTFTESTLETLNNFVERFCNTAFKNKNLFLDRLDLEAKDIDLLLYKITSNLESSFNSTQKCSIILSHNKFSDNAKTIFKLFSPGKTYLNLINENNERQFFTSFEKFTARLIPSADIKFEIKVPITDEIQKTTHENKKLRNEYEKAMAINDIVKLEELINNNKGIELKFGEHQDTLLHWAYRRGLAGLILLLKAKNPTLEGQSNGQNYLPHQLAENKATNTNQVSLPDSISNTNQHRFDFNQANSNDNKDHSNEEKNSNANYSSHSF